MDDRIFYRTNAEGIRPMHEWTSTFERYWAHQLNRIKERAEKNEQGAIMNATAQAIDNLTLNITQEIHVRASLDATFAAILEEIGPHNRSRRQAYADED